MQSLNFIPLITKATRFPSGGAYCSPSLLDHIWSNSFTLCSSDIIVIDISDHCPVFLNLLRVINRNENIKLTFRIHCPNNMLKLKQRVISLTDLVLVDGNDNLQTNLFVNELNSLYSSRFSIKIKFISAKTNMQTLAYFCNIEVY